MTTDARDRRRPAAVGALLALAGLLGACRQDMHDQPRYEPLEASTFFADGMASRLPIEGTIARGQLREDTAYFTGKTEAGVVVASLPMAVDGGVLRRGRERYDIFCSPCHGRLGDGTGMVVERGFKRPPSLHEARLVEQPVGYYFDVMSNGFGVMSSYASQITVEDRWAIAAYLRALQLSQGVELASLPAADQEAMRRLDAGEAVDPDSTTEPEPAHH